MAQTNPYKELEKVERRFLAEELERRIEEFERGADAGLGRFTPLDWIVCVIGAFLLPALAIIWWAP